MARETEFYPLISRAAGDTGLAWWLLYGVIEQESQFDPQAESGCGALGLMQLMPASFPAFERTALLDPAENIRLGAEFLRECVRIWRKESEDEAMRFGLASYNGGAGYILQAQQRAEELGRDPSRWEDVAACLDQVEFKGKRPDVAQITNYVQRIWTKFEQRRDRPAPPAGVSAA